MMALLDTHAFVRVAFGPAEPWMAELTAGIAVSPATAAEIACLWRLRRLLLNTPPDQWFEDTVATLGATITPTSASLLARSQAFPWAHRDPFDRILVQTAREDATLVLFTRDAQILDYCALNGIRTRDCR